jgi:membrane-bound lytic murein transglycosylase A
MGIWLKSWAIATSVLVGMGAMVGGALAQDAPLQWVATPTDTALGLDDQLWGTDALGGDRQALLSAIDYSLRYLETPAAMTDYQATYPVEGITRDRVRRSLERFRELLLTTSTPEALQAAVQQEFDWYQAVGNDGMGTVHFTGYFEPVYAASRTPSAEYRFPLYREPTDLDQWAAPQPTRADLEGTDGLGGTQGILDGLELVWMRDRLEAYLVHVQGSARLQLPDGSTMSIGYAGRTDYPYTSLGRELVNEGIFSLEEVTLPLILDYFAQHPDELNHYLPRNNRFVFFQETDGGAPTGTLDVPVTAERSIATDKTLMPPGAIALLHATLPFPDETGGMEFRTVSRYVLDQDTGGAIQGPGRVDIFMGTGDVAGDRAGLMNTDGQLYFLLLKDNSSL